MSSEASVNSDIQVIEAREAFLQKQLLAPSSTSRGAAAAVGQRMATGVWMGEANAAASQVQYASGFMSFSDIPQAAHQSGSSSDAPSDEPECAGVGGGGQGSGGEMPPYWQQLAERYWLPAEDEI